MHNMRTQFSPSPVYLEPRLGTLFVLLQGQHARIDNTPMRIVLTLLIGGAVVNLYSVETLKVGSVGHLVTNSTVNRDPRAFELVSQ